MSLLYDAAYAPSLTLCKQRGAIAVSHYMSRGYMTTSAQPAKIKAAGLGCLHNWEGYANEMIGATRAKGRSIAAEALAELPSWVPRDNTKSIYFSIDADVTNFASTDECLRGINEVLRPAGVLVGIYAEGDLILRYAKLGLTQVKGWLSMSEGFTASQNGLTSHERYLGFINSGKVGLVQMHDKYANWIGTDIPGTDRNTIIDPYGLGIDWPTGSPYLKGSTGMAMDPDVKAAFAALNAQLDKQAALLATVPDEVWGNTILRQDGSKVSAATLLDRGNSYAFAAAKGVVDVDKFSAAVVGKLPAGTLTQDQLHQAIRDTLGSTTLHFDTGASA